MKHRRQILAVLLGIALILAAYTGCSSNSYAKESSAPGSGFAEPGYYADEPVWDEKAEEMPAPAESAGLGGNTAGDDMAGSDLDQQARDMSEKIIYQGSATIETTEFDKTLADLDAMIAELHGFVENTSVTGQSYESSYYKKASLRSASYTIRIPKESFTRFKNDLSVFGYVTNTSYWTENVTTRFMDVESRLATYRAEEASLLAMMEKAETVEDMITVESRLSDVRYEIESLTSTLRYYQNQVDYSTMNLSIREVKVITEEQEIPVTYWDEIRESFRDGWSFTVNAVKWVGRAIVTLVPALIVPAIIVVIIVIAVRSRAAKRRAMYARYAQAPQAPGPAAYPGAPVNPQNPGQNPPNNRTEL